MMFLDPCGDSLANFLNNLLGAMGVYPCFD